MNEQKSILAVDDEPDLLEVLALVLETHDYRVHTAECGFGALDVLRTHPVDLIIADIAMPRMNGYQLFKEVAANPRWVRIPFIFLTARNLDSDVRFGKELGVDDYLLKPLQAEELLASVRGKLKLAARRAIDLPDESGVSAKFSPADRLQLGLLEIDPLRHRVWMNEKPIKLSAREFKVVEHLAAQPLVTVAAEELIRLTHELEIERQEASDLIRPLIRSIRRKFGYPSGDLGCIENVRGIGYRLIPPL